MRTGGFRNFSRQISPFVQGELAAAKTCEDRGDFEGGFAHLERAHVLGQASTRLHVHVHWHMLLWGLNHGGKAGIAGQIFRIVGAATLTSLGLVPHGNTGGSNVSPVLRMSIPADLAALIAKAQGC